MVQKFFQLELSCINRVYCKGAQESMVRILENISSVKAAEKPFFSKAQCDFVLSPKK